MSATSQTPPSPRALRVADLSAGRPTAFVLEPSAEARRKMAAELNLLSLKKLRFTGEVRPQGKTDWHLDATLGATVSQPCAVTLDPVTTRIDEAVTRTFLRDHSQPDDPEAEMPEDDTTEPLGTWIDLEAVMIEALSLALPLYPRAPGAESGSAVFAEPGVTPMTDDDAKPFAGLAGLRDSLGSKD